MILRITRAEIGNAGELRLGFSNGASGTVDVRPLLRGPIFEPLKDQAFFKQARLDPVSHTVAWPNGADFAPEALLDLHVLQNSARGGSAELAGILEHVKAAARRYQEVTGRPLGITGEVAEIEAVDKLGLVATPVRHAGYDALRLGPDGIERLQIKGRRLGQIAGRHGRIGGLKLAHAWDSVVLVLLDNDFNASKIYEADRPVVERALTAPGSLSRTERGQLGVRDFVKIGREVWSRQE